MTITIDVRSAQRALAQATQRRKEQALAQARRDSNSRCFACPSISLFFENAGKTCNVHCGCKSQYIALQLPEDEAITVCRPKWCPRNQTEAH